MKQLSIIALLGLGLSLCHARTWTNVDGTKSFEAKFISSTEADVSLLRKGKKIIFKKDFLSEDDREWIKAEEDKKLLDNSDAKDIEDEKEINLEDLGAFAQKLGKKVTKFEKTRYKKASLTKDAKFYILYFSASW